MLFGTQAPYETRLIMPIKVISPNGWLLGHWCVVGGLEIVLRHFCKAGGFSIADVVIDISSGPLFGIYMDRSEAHNARWDTGVSY